jgi:hypothetical protein
MELKMSSLTRLFVCGSLVCLLSLTLCAEPVLAQAKTKRGKKEAGAPGVADYTSKNFMVRTDLPPDEAKDLLKRLETMLVLIEKYFDHKLTSPIGMFVVKDLKAWPREAVNQFDPGGLRSIEDGGGLTIGQTRQSIATGQILDAKAVVYAVADRGTPQHEAVHAYCVLSFGRTGPTWYSEGMAEIGQYWTDKGLGVHCHDVVLEYLKSQEPKELTEIVDVGDSTGDSWQNYAWRWVLCHMLANNPNYAPRFKPLGLGLLNDKDVSFESVYGSMAKEINFEYQFFLRHIGQGYRADLCAWDWKAKFTPCKGSTPFTAKVEANRGWQPSRISVEAGQSYDFSASGTWKLNSGAAAVGGDGDEMGAGRLVGIIFDDYKLSEPFPLGAYGSFTPPQSGNLMLRCEDQWHELADNSGKLQVRLKLTGKGNPLPMPETKASGKDAPVKPGKSKSSTAEKSS